MIFGDNRGDLLHQQVCVDPPIIMGHSFGGAFAQILVSASLGVAGMSKEHLTEVKVIVKVNDLSGCNSFK